MDLKVLKGISIGILFLLSFEMFMGIPFPTNAATSNVQIVSNIPVLPLAGVTLIAINNPTLGSVASSNVTQALVELATDTYIVANGVQYSLAADYQDFYWVPGTNTFYLLLGFNQNTTVKINGVPYNEKVNSTGGYVLYPSGMPVYVNYALKVNTLNSSPVKVEDYAKTTTDILNVYNIPTQDPAASSAKSVTVVSSGQSLTLNVLQNSASSYTISVYTTENYVPINSTWESFVYDPAFQYDPFNQTMIGKDSMTFYENVSYLPTLISNTRNTTTFAVGDSSTTTVFQNSVYTGNYTIYATSNSTYETDGVPVNYYTLITGKYFTTATVISEEFYDPFSYNSSYMVTGQIKETVPQSVTVSSTTPSELYISAFDNVTNFSVTNYLHAVYLQFISTITGAVIKTVKITVPEVSPGSPMFGTLIQLSFGPQIVVTQNSYYNVTTIVLPAQDFSTTKIVAYATNDIGAAYWYITGTFIPTNTSSLVAVQTLTPNLTLVSPTVTTLPNTTTHIVFNYYEPNLAFGKLTTLNVINKKTYSLLEYNGTQIANATVKVTFSNGTVAYYNLGKFEVPSTITSPTGNGQFNFTLFLLPIEPISPGTTMQVEIYDYVVDSPLSVLVTFQVIAPVVYLEPPTQSTFTTSGVAYIPSYVANPAVFTDTHYVDVSIIDTQEGQTFPNSVLSVTGNLVVLNSSSDLPLPLYYIPTGVTAQSISLSATETKPDSGNFTTTFNYELVKGTYDGVTGYFLVIDGNYIPESDITGKPLTANQLIGMTFTVAYTSPVSKLSALASDEILPAPMKIMSSVGSANPGAPVNVTVYAPGLVQAHNIKITNLAFLYANFTAWNGTGALVKVENDQSAIISENSAGNSIFSGIVYMGNSTAPMNGLTTAGYTFTPGTTAYFYVINPVSTLSTITSSVTQYHVQTISVNDEVPQVMVIAPPVEGPYGGIEILLGSPLFTLFQHPSNNTYDYLVSPSGALDVYGQILSAQLAEASSEVAGDTFTSGTMVSAAGVGYYVNFLNGTGYWLIDVPTTAWGGEPGVFTTLDGLTALNVNITDTVTVIGNQWSFTQITAPGKGIVAAYGSVKTYTVGQVDFAQVQPETEIMYNGTVITNSTVNVVPFPTTSAGELVTVSVIAPDLVGLKSTFNVTVRNPVTGVLTTLPLVEQYEIIDGIPVPTDNYSGELRVVPYSAYGSYEGMPGVLPIKTGVVNPILVNTSVTEIPNQYTPSLYINGKSVLLEQSSNAYFYVGQIIIKFQLLSFQAISETTGAAVTQLTANQSYDLLFTVKNTGDVNATVWFAVEVHVGTTVVTPILIGQTVVPAGSTYTEGLVWTPSMPGTYNVTMFLARNANLTIPYIPAEFTEQVQVVS